MRFYVTCTVALCPTPASHVLVEPRSNLYFCDEHWTLMPELREWWTSRWR